MKVYPVPDRSFNWVENFTSKYGFVGICLVCGRLTYFDKFYDNHRELGYCALCRASNRKRQLCYLLRKFLNLGDLGKITSGRYILNAESSGGLHESLKHNVNYVLSEYFGEAYESGAIVDGILNVNLTDSHFAENTFDIVLTSDVFEHISLSLQGL